MLLKRYPVSALVSPVSYLQFRATVFHLSFSPSEPSNLLFSPCTLSFLTLDPFFFNSTRNSRHKELALTPTSNIYCLKNKKHARTADHDRADQEFSNARVLPQGVVPNLLHQRALKSIVFNGLLNGILQHSQRGAYWRIGVPMIHSLRTKPPLCDPGWSLFNNSRSWPGMSWNNIHDCKWPKSEVCRVRRFSVYRHT